MLAEKLQVSSDRFDVRGSGQYVGTSVGLKYPFMEGMPSATAETGSLERIPRQKFAKMNGCEIKATKSSHHRLHISLSGVVQFCVTSGG